MFTSHIKSNTPVVHITKKTILNFLIKTYKSYISDFSNCYPSQHRYRYNWGLILWKEGFFGILNSVSCALRWLCSFFVKVKTPRPVNCYNNAFTSRIFSVTSPSHYLLNISRCVLMILISITLQQEFARCVTCFWKLINTKINIHFI